MSPHAGAKSPDGDEEGRLAAYLAARSRLLGLAYRMLGTRTDAEDVVQEAWLRLQRTERRPDNPAAWLTTVTSRLALDRLRAARRRRETYVGPWLPEPVRTGTPADAPGDPAEITDRAATLTLGFLVLLDTLEPDDRVVFLLADVFGVPFADIAAAVGRSTVACRQAASRARRRLRQAAPAGLGTHQQAWSVAAGLAAAVAAGDLDATLAVLAPDVHLVSDGGASRHAARRPVHGPDRVARLLLNVARRLPASARGELAEVNGEPAIVVRVGDRPETVLVVEVDTTGHVHAIRVVVAPDKLARLDDPLVLL